MIIPHLPHAGGLKIYRFVPVSDGTANIVNASRKRVQRNWTPKFVDVLRNNRVVEEPRLHPKLQVNYLPAKVLKADVCLHAVFIVKAEPDRLVCWVARLGKRFVSAWIFAACLPQTEEEFCLVLYFGENFRPSISWELKLLQSVQLLNDG